MGGVRISNAPAEIAIGAREHQPDSNQLRLSESSLPARNNGSAIHRALIVLDGGRKGICPCFCGQSGPEPMGPELVFASPRADLPRIAKRTSVFLWADADLGEALRQPNAIPSSKDLVLVYRSGKQVFLRNLEVSGRGFLQAKFQPCKRSRNSILSEHTILWECLVPTLHEDYMQETCSRLIPDLRSFLAELSQMETSASIDSESTTVPRLVPSQQGLMLEGSSLKGKIVRAVIIVDVLHSALRISDPDRAAEGPGMAFRTLKGAIYAFDAMMNLPPDKLLSYGQGDGVLHERGESLDGGTKGLQGSVTPSKYRQQFSSTSAEAENMSRLNLQDLPALLRPAALQSPKDGVALPAKQFQPDLIPAAYPPGSGGRSGNGSVGHWACSGKEGTAYVPGIPPLRLPFGTGRGLAEGGLLPMSATRPMTPIRISDERIKQCVAGMKLGSPDYLRTSLLLLQDLDDQNYDLDPENFAWTGSWVRFGALEAVVNAKLALPPRFDPDLFSMLDEAIGILVCTQEGAARFVRFLHGKLAGDWLPGVVTPVLELLLLGLNIPTVWQAAQQCQLFRDLLSGLNRYLISQQDLSSERETGRNSRRNEGLSSSDPQETSSQYFSPNLSPKSKQSGFWTATASSSETSGQTGSPAKTGSRSRRSPRVSSPNPHQSPYKLNLPQKEAMAESPNISSMRIPALHLPSVESSPMSTAKMTRSDRRCAAHYKPSFAVSTPAASPGPWRAPDTSPRDPSWASKLVMPGIVEEMGLVMGQTLIAGDLAALMAHKRSETLLRSNSDATSMRLHTAEKAHRRTQSMQSSTPSGELKTPGTVPRISARFPLSSRPSKSSRLSSIRSEFVSISARQKPGAEMPQRSDIAGALKGSNSDDTVDFTVEALWAVVPIHGSMEATPESVRAACSMLVKILTSLQPTAYRLNADPKKAHAESCEPLAMSISCMELLCYLEGFVPQCSSELVETCLEVVQTTAHNASSKALNLNSKQGKLGKALGMLHQYLHAQQRSTAIDGVISTCLPVFTKLVSSWFQDRHPSRQFGSSESSAHLPLLAEILACLLKKCKDANKGQDLVRFILTQRHMTSLMRDACSQETGNTLDVLPGNNRPSRSAGCFTAVLNLHQAVFQFLNRSQAVQHIEGGEFGAREFGPPMSKADAIERCQYLLDIPGGQAFEQLKKGSKSRQGGSNNARSAALGLLAESGQIPASAVHSEKEQIDILLHTLWLQFAILYTSPKSRDLSATCTGYLKVMRALARTHEPQIRRKFVQLRVVDFLVRELSLEYESTLITGMPSTSSRAAPMQKPHMHGGLRTPGIAPDSVGRASYEKTISETSDSESDQAYETCDDTSLADTTDVESSLDSRSVSQYSARYSGRRANEFPAVLRSMPSLSSSRAYPPSTIAKPIWSTTGPTNLSRFSSMDRPSAREEGSVNKSAHESKPNSRLGIPKLGLSFASQIAPGLASSRTSSRPIITSSRARPHNHGQNPLAALKQKQSARRQAIQNFDTSNMLLPEAAANDSQRSEQSSFDLPAGFVFSGDLDDDLDRLERLQNGSEDGDTTSSLSESECSSDSSSPAPENLSKLILPQLRLPLKAVSSSSGTKAEASDKAEDILKKQLMQPAPNIPALRLPAFQPSDTGLSRSGSKGNTIPILHFGLTKKEDASMAVGKMQAASHAAGLEDSALQRSPMLKPHLNGLHPGERHNSDQQLPKAAAGEVKVQSWSRNSLEHRYLQHEDSSEQGESSSLVYTEERSNRILYADPELHCIVVALLLELLFNDNSQLDSAYCSSDPTKDRAQNILHLLSHHLSHPWNASLLPNLLRTAEEIGPHATRLVRVLCRTLFCPALYKMGQLIGRGAFARVHTAEAPGCHSALVMKIIDVPAGAHESCVQYDLFTEVTILEHTKGLKVSELLDYGLAEDHFILVQKAYKTSLTAWRKKQGTDWELSLGLYLKIFAAAVDIVKELQAKSVVHFDIKADNVLLEPLPGVGEDEFWKPTGTELPFSLVFADFGESKLFSEPEGAMTVRNRGTEFIKSPEMLLVANASKKEAKSYDRRKRQGAGAASDVWSLGCLLWEIIMGEYLFFDDDWIRFFMRVTKAPEVLPEEKLAALNGCSEVKDLLRTILVRPPMARPSPEGILNRVQAIVAKLSAQSAAQKQSLTQARQKHQSLHRPQPTHSRNWSRTELEGLCRNRLDDQAAAAFWSTPCQIAPNIFLTSSFILEDHPELLTKLNLGRVILLTDIAMDQGHSPFMSKLSQDLGLRECLIQCQTLGLDLKCLQCKHETSTEPEVGTEKRIWDLCVEGISQLCGASSGSSCCEGTLILASQDCEGRAYLTALRCRMKQLGCSLYDSLSYMLRTNPAPQVQGVDADLLELLLQEH